MAKFGRLSSIPRIALGIIVRALTNPMPAIAIPFPTILNASTIELTIKSMCRKIATRPIMAPATAAIGAMIAVKTVPTIPLIKAKLEITKETTPTSFVKTDPTAPSKPNIGVIIATT